MLNAEVENCMENQKEYILDGLCCANCAAKIEKEVGEMSEVKEANINLVNQKLRIVLSGEESTELKERISSIVSAHESSVKVRDVSDTEESIKAKENKRTENKWLKHYLFRLGLSIVLVFLFSLIDFQGPIRVAGLIIAYAIAGYETLITAAKNILKGKVFDENFLMGIASLGAFLMGERIEAIAVLIFYGIGELLQDMAVDKSRRNIAELMDIRPDYANKISDGKLVVVAPEELAAGDRILIRPGEKIPMDGVIRKGNSFIDTRALTGESVPRKAAIDDVVFSGTVNTSAVIEVEVTKLYGESTVSKILEMVQNAGSKKAVSEKFITKFAGYYTPAVVFIAVAVALLPPLFGFGAFTVWLYRALSFLIISCPCALVISIPLSFFGGIGGGARQGVLVKGGNYLDALKRIDTIVFDKTGTLTKGVFEVTNVMPADGVTEEEIIRLAAIAESHSTHPIAKSIMNYAKKNSLNIITSDAQIQEIAGHGVMAELDGYTILAGNEKLMRQYGITYSQTASSGSIVHIALDHRYMGYLLIADELKPGVKATVEALKQLGVKHIIMLTGDRKSAAKETAELCMIEEYEAELLPQEKVAWFETYKARAGENGKVVFVGDGINDAPVLAGADIGIAMGGIGSDAAIEAADVVIMNDEPGKIVTAIKIARKTNRIVTQNIIFALGVKGLIMILAFFGITSIWFAIFADVGVALLALLNALRAMYMK